MMIRVNQMAMGVLLFAALKVAAADNKPDLQFGDLLFQSLPRNAVVNMIEGATNSPYSHCGILIGQAGEWQVLEAIGPVKTTPLKAWIKQSRDKKTYQYRLKARYRAQLPAFVTAARGYMGRPYDIRYRLDDERIYCSELIYKAFKDVVGEELGVLVQLKTLNWQPHKQTILYIERGPVPLERTIITPKHLAEANQLEFVTALDYRPSSPKKLRALFQPRRTEAALFPIPTPGQKSSGLSPGEQKTQK